VRGASAVCIRTGEGSIFCNLTVTFLYSTNRTPRVREESENHMARCTAPVRGHRTASARAECPACGGRGGYGGYSGYRSYSPPSYSSPSYSSSGSRGGRSSGGGSSRSTKPRWSGAGSSQFYTPEEVRALTPIRDTVEKRASLPDLRHIFLCQAWDDRQGVAKELCDLLVARNVTVWFSENDIGLGEPFLRAIDKGLAKSRIGIVLVTPALQKRLPAAGVADKELSVLLARDQLVPIVHNTTYEALREVSPMLASRNGLETAEMPMADVAAKLAELVTL
jgi:TIR domain